MPQPLHVQVCFSNAAFVPLFSSLWYSVSVSLIIFITSSSSGTSPRNTFISNVGNACSPCLNNSGEKGRAIRRPSALTKRTSDIGIGNVADGMVLGCVAGEMIGTGDVGDDCELEATIILSIGWLHTYMLDFR